MLYLSEAVALPVRMARPPPAETTRCVDCQITDHFTVRPPAKVRPVLVRQSVNPVPFAGAGLAAEHTARGRTKKKAGKFSDELTGYGGDGEIRTLEGLLTLTRFPIVRARPTTRHLHALLEPKLFS